MERVAPRRRGGFWGEWPEKARNRSSGPITWGQRRASTDSETRRCTTPGGPIPLVAPRGTMWGLAEPAALAESAARSCGVRMAGRVADRIAAAGLCAVPLPSRAVGPVTTPNDAYLLPGACAASSIRSARPRRAHRPREIGSENRIDHRLLRKTCALPAIRRDVDAPVLRPGPDQPVLRHGDTIALTCPSLPRRGPPRPAAVGARAAPPRDSRVARGAAGAAARGAARPRRRARRRGGGAHVRELRRRRRPRRRRTRMVLAAAGQPALYGQAVELRYVAAASSSPCASALAPPSPTACASS